MQNYHVEQPPVGLDGDELDSRIGLSMKHCSKSELLQSLANANVVINICEDDEVPKVQVIMDRIESEIERRSVSC